MPQKRCPELVPDSNVYQLTLGTPEAAEATEQMEQFLRARVPYPDNGIAQRASWHPVTATARDARGDTAAYASKASVSRTPALAAADRPTRASPWLHGARLLSAQGRALAGGEEMLVATRMKDRETLRPMPSWFVSVLRSQGSDDELIRDSVGLAVPQEDSHRGEVHRQ
jgi:hypothetical protein